EHLRLRRGVQTGRHVPKMQQPHSCREAQHCAEQDQHEHRDVDDGIRDLEAEHVHDVVLSLRATYRATEIDPNTPMAAMMSITGMLLVCPLMAITTPSTHITTVRRTSVATARSSIEGPRMIRKTVRIAATPKTTTMTPIRMFIADPPRVRLLSRHDTAPDCPAPARSVAPSAARLHAVHRHPLGFAPR